MLLALSLLALALPCQEHVQDFSAEKPQNRLLFCNGGAVLRGLTRRSSETAGWELRREGKWTAIPLGLVVSTEMEKAVELSFAQQWKAAAPGDLDAQAQAGGWALQHGLLEEGLKTLDALLKSNPNLASARNAICAQAIRFRPPPVQSGGKPVAAPLAKAIDPLLSWCIPRGPALQELGIVELARLRDRAALLNAMTALLGSKDAGRRRMASLVLRRLFPGKAHRPLILHAVLDPDADVRASTALSLAGAHDTTLILPLVNTLESSHPTLRQRAAEALGRMQYPAAVEPLVQRLRAVTQPGAATGGIPRPPHSNIFVGTQFAYIQDFDVEVAMGSAIADPVVNVLTSGAVLDVGVISVSGVHFARETRAIRVALGQLTGDDPGNTNRAWLKWWEKNSGKWMAKRFLEPAPSTAGSSTAKPPR
jgi:hypothetical protein